MADRELVADDVGERLAAGFVRVLRLAGLEVPVGAAVAFGRALGVVGVDRRASVYWAGRATLVNRPEDIELYDTVFAAFWEHVPLRRVEGQPTESVTILLDDETDDGLDAADGDRDQDAPVVSLRYSPHEVLRHKDFAEFTDDELDEAHRLMSRMRLPTTTRPSRRQVTSKRQRGRPDLRRTIRHALRAGGEPMQRSFLEPSVQARRLVLLLDVSGSMESYARALLRFVHAAVVGRRRVEAFALGTRLTRVTRELSSRDPDEAFAAATDAVEDWSGGTRLGDALGRFNDEWGVRGMARGAIVVIMSDGWDRGSPAIMGEQMARLSRVAHRIVWVNPLKASPGYAPLAQGMAAALPFVDEFIEGHSVASLEQLAAAIAA